DRRDRGEPKEDQEPNDRGQRAGELGLLAQDQDVERVEARELIDQQDAHERDDRSDGQKQRQLHRGVFLAVGGKVEDEPDRIALFQAFGIGHVQVALGMAAPDSQQEVHRDDRHLIKEIEEEQVQGHEHADGGGSQDQQEDVKLLGAVLDVPGDEDPGKQ